LPDQALELRTCAEHDGAWMSWAFGHGENLDRLVMQQQPLGPEASGLEVLWCDPRFVRMEERFSGGSPFFEYRQFLVRSRTSGCGRWQLAQAASQAETSMGVLAVRLVEPLFGELAGMRACRRLRGLLDGLLFGFGGRQTH